MSSTITSNSSPPFIHALAAMIGSVSSFLLFYPFERVRVEIQSRSTLEEEEENEDVAKVAREKTKNSIKGISKKCDVNNPNNDGSKQYSESISSKGSNKKASTNSFQSSQRRSVEPNILKMLIILHRKNQLYYGVSSFTWAIAISNFIFFYLYEVTKSILPLHEHDNFAIKTFLASTIASSINVILTNPLWVANMRIIDAANHRKQNSTHKHSSKDCYHNQTSTGPLLLFHYLQSIAKNEGVSQLWNGTITSLLLICNPVIQKFAYDTLRHKILLHRVLRQQQQHLSTPIVLKPIEAFLLGALSKAVATILTYPLQLAQVLLRLQKKNGNIKDSVHEKNIVGNTEQLQSQSHDRSNINHYSGTVDCLKKLHSSGGVRAMFRGVNAKLLQTVLTSAFTFLTYEQIIAVLLTGYNATNRGTCKI